VLNWSLKLREEHRITLFKNMLLLKIVGPKRREKTGELRRL
jgi:hypothetical protein